MIIDAYTHCGVEKFRPIEDVRAMMEANGISRAVLAQHLGQFDNSYIADCVLAAPEDLVGVAMVDTAAADAERALAEVIAHPAFTGLRMTAPMLVQAPHIASQALASGLHLVLYCPDGIETIEDTLAHLADGPGRIVVTHLGSPIVEGDEVVRGAEILRLAADPRVMVTLSGAGMACAPPHEPLRPLVRSVVQAFGADRVMWASNFPVVGDIEQVCEDLELTRSNSWGIDEAGLALVLGESAERTWFAGRNRT